jgi:transcriptional regulator with XRE-family HTH domain
MPFAAMLRDLREKSKLTQGQLALRAKVSIDSLRNWEQGRSLPKITEAARLATVLGISLKHFDSLATEEPDEAPAPTKSVPRRKLAE